MDAIFGFHIGTLLGADIPSGTVIAPSGCCMAAFDKFTIRVRGRGCHGSTPEKGVDPVNAAAHIVLSLQAITTREISAARSLVLTIGKVTAGSRWNVLAGSALLEGTIRTFTTDTKVEEEMRRIVENTAAAFGAKATMTYNYMTPPVINSDEQLVRIAQDAVGKLYGKEYLVDVPTMMGSEDFANYAAEIPAVFGFIGCRDEANGMIYNNHHEKFTVNESLLPKGTALMAQFAVDYLAGNA